ncbi:hypothetical protein E4J89_15915 [Arthrobacter sp. CAU 1506]|nr:hypothetical protein E4J89_15915 [Arthrobacter sp. CAU 1506]
MGATTRTAPARSLTGSAVVYQEAPWPLTSFDIDRDKLKQAKQLTGATSNRKTVDLALRTLIAVRRQPAAVERIISGRFEPSQIDAATVTPPAVALPSAPLGNRAVSPENDSTRPAH